MSLINLRYLPKNSFTSIIFPYIKTYHNELALLDSNIKIGNSKFTLKNNTELEYSISEMHKIITIYTKISTNIYNTDFNIHEKITIKKNTYDTNTNDYSNYSINIVNLKNKPYIYSIKCIHQPISFDLMNHYTDDIKKMYEQIKK
jgi:hypothetical protein